MTDNDNKADQYQSLMAGAARRHGFRLLGIGALAKEPDFERFSDWLAAGRQAGMSYLSNNQSIRADPRKLLSASQSAIILGLDYHPGQHPGGPRIAAYAQMRDYHKIFWRSGEALWREFCGHCPEAAEAEVRIVADSAPMLERAFVARHGQGFIGKNCCYIEPTNGSFTLLGFILTTFELGPTVGLPIEPKLRGENGGCGSCRRCQVHCPTGALDEDYSIDANLCLAYWSIEHRGEVPEKFWPHFSRYWFGCDICQDVCPYNRDRAGPSPWVERTKLPSIELERVATMTQAQYEKWFGGTPMTRAKHSGLVRNAIIALTVTRPTLLTAVRAHWSDGRECPELIDRTLDQADAYLKAASTSV